MRALGFLFALLFGGTALAQPGPLPPLTFTPTLGSVPVTANNAVNSYLADVKSFGAKGDAKSFGAASGTSPGVPGNAATMTAGSAALVAAAATTFTAADIGKAITVDGAGVAAGPLSTTIASVQDPQHATLAAIASTSTPQFTVSSGAVTTDQAGVGSYAPGDTVTLTGGSGTQAVMTVQATQVHSVTVNAAGSGGTTGACVLTGTTGTSASGLGLFQVNATITAGAVSAIGSFVTQGIYTTNPTSIVAEPVTSSCSVTGVTLTLIMGVKYAYPSNQGLYSTLPAEPIAQGSTSGSGTGATFSPITNATGNFYYGTDDSAAFAAAVTKMNTVMAAGTPAVLQVPPGNYLLRSTPIPIFAGPGSIVGEGQLNSVVMLDAGYSGDLFSWTEAWNVRYPFNANTPSLNPLTAGPQVIGLGVVGDRSAAAQQNAFMFYDRIGNALMQDVSVFYLPGAAIKSGTLKNAAASFMQESMFKNIRVQNSGLAGVAAVEIASLGSTGGSGDIQLTDINIYGSAGAGMWIHSAGSSNVAGVQIENVRIEGLEWNPNGNTGDLLELGDTTGNGNLSNIQITNASLIDPYLGSAALHIVQPSGPTGNTFDINFKGSIAGIFGRGLWLSGGRNSTYALNGITSNDYNVVVDSSTFVGAANQILNLGHIAFTSSVDATQAQSQATWLAPPMDAGAIRARIAGNSRGANAVDLQSSSTNTAAQVASGATSVVTGGFSNTASAASSYVGGGQTNTASASFCGVVGGASNTCSGSSAFVGAGQGNIASGSFGFIPGGFHAADRGLYGSFCWASGDFTVNADAQQCEYLLRGSTASTSTARLTDDGLTAGSTNCVNIPTLTGYSLVVDVYAFDHTTPANTEFWLGYTGTMIRTGNTGTTNVVMGTKPTPVSQGTVTGWDITVTHDTTNGCLSVILTPPNPNTDTIRAVAKVRTIQVQ